MNAVDVLIGIGAFNEKYHPPNRFDERELIHGILDQYPHPVLFQADILPAPTKPDAPFLTEALTRLRKQGVLTRWSGNELSFKIDPGAYFDQKIAPKLTPDEIAGIREVSGRIGS